MRNAVLHVSYDYLPIPLWGVGRHVAALAHGLRLRGVDARVATRSSISRVAEPPYGLTRVYRSSAILDRLFLQNPMLPGESYRDFDLLQCWNSLFAEQLLRKLLAERWTPTLIHNHSWMTWRLALTIAQHYRCPIVSSIHFLERQYHHTGHHPSRADEREILSIEQEYLQQAGQLVVFSDRTINLLKQQYGFKSVSKVSVIPHGRTIGPEGGQALPARVYHKQIRVLFCGRIVREKGIHELLAVAKSILRVHPDVAFIIVGDGPDLQDLRSKYVHPRIKFYGHLHTPNLIRQYMMSDIFCLPTMTETFGLTTLEAMSFGLPVITTGGVTVAPIVEHLRTGLVVPLKFGQKTTIPKPALDAVLRRLIRDPGLRHRLGSAAKKYADAHFTETEMVANTLRCYRSIAPLFLPHQQNHN